MVVKNGRFGPYVTDGDTNASLRKGDDVDTLTVQRAAELLADRRAAAPTRPARPGAGRRRRGRRQSPARRSRPPEDDGQKAEVETLVPIR